MKASAMSIAGGAAAGGGLWYSSQAVLAAHAEGWNADDPEAVQTNDGTIDDVVLTSDTEVGIQYDNLAEEDQEATIEISAIPEGSSQTSAISSGTVTLSGTSGHETYGMNDWDPSIEGGRSFIENHPDIDRSDFEPDDEGETKDTTIHLGLKVTISDGEDEGLTASPDDTTFTTTVTWNESTMEAGGDGQIDVQV